MVLHYYVFLRIIDLCTKCRQKASTDLSVHTDLSVLAFLGEVYNRQ